MSLAPLTNLGPPKVLLIAHSCEPGRGSEWGLSWSFVGELARHQPVWVLAHADNQPGLDAYLAAHPQPHPVHPTYVRGPRWARWLRRMPYALQSVYYYLWQFSAGRAAVRLHESVGLDVVQHVSYSRWWMPSAGAALARRGVKFVFGPCVGGEQIPAGFRASIPLSGRWREFQRWAATAIWTRDPMLARCVRDADLVAVGTPAAARGVGRYGPRRLEVIPAVQVSDTRAVDAARPARNSRPSLDPIFRVASVGGVSYFRGVDLILRALARSGIDRFEYTHCCGGPSLDAMRRLAFQLGIADRVTFTGETRHAENLRYVARADVLAHLMLRNSQGVVPEALSLGVPVLVLDHHSMSAVIDDRVGHKIPMPEGASPRSVVDAAARKLREWYDDRSLLGAMHDACVDRARELGPVHRVAMFRRWHDELLGRPTAPSVEPPFTIRASA